MVTASGMKRTRAFCGQLCPRLALGLLSSKTATGSPADSKDLCGVHWGSVNFFTVRKRLQCIITWVLLGPESGLHLGGHITPVKTCLGFTVK